MNIYFFFQESKVLAIQHCRYKVDTMPSAPIATLVGRSALVTSLSFFQRNPVSPGEKNEEKTFFQHLA